MSCIRMSRSIAALLLAVSVLAGCGTPVGESRLALRPDAAPAPAALRPLSASQGESLPPGVDPRRPLAGPDRLPCQPIARDASLAPRRLMATMAPSPTPRPTVAESAEPNDEPARAVGLTLGEDVLGSAAAGSRDVDYFRVSLPPAAPGQIGGTLHLSLVAEDELHTTLTVVGRSDVAPGGTLPANPGQPTESQLAFEAQAGATYVIRAEHAPRPAEVRYRLTSWLAVSSRLDSHPAFLVARPLEPGETLSFYAYDGDGEAPNQDQDVFGFQVPAGATSARVRIDGAVAAGTRSRFSIALYGPAGELVGEHCADAGDFDLDERFALTRAGKHYIQVIADVESEAAHRLTVTLR